MVYKPTWPYIRGAPSCCKSKIYQKMVWPHTGASWKWGKSPCYLSFFFFFFRDPSLKNGWWDDDWGLAPVDETETSHSFYINQWLVGGFNTSEKYESQLGWWHSQYFWENKKWQPNHQPDGIKWYPPVSNHGLMEHVRRFSDENLQQKHGRFPCQRCLMKPRGTATFQVENVCGLHGGTVR